MPHLVRSPRVNSVVLATTLLIVTFPLLAHGATHYVASTGTDGPGCGVDATTACQSISQAIALAAPGDTILVGPGRYGDLNRNGVSGDVPGEETGSPGCGCVLSINKYVIVLSSAGAAVTMIDGRSVDTLQNVLLITDAGEFGRPGKGFTVTSTARASSYGIALDSGNVMVRGNQVIYMPFPGGLTSTGTGIITVNSSAVRIEGNQVINWRLGISARGAAIVSKNQVILNETGISTSGGTVIGNVATANRYIGIAILEATERVTVTTNAVYRNGSTGVYVPERFDGTITKNNMFANGYPPAYNCGLSNSDDPDLVATNNYWGVPAGPGAPPRDTVCESTPGMTITSPFATKPFTVTVLKP
jgi:hypothetical protein